MRQLWDRGRPVTVREVLLDLERERIIAYTTVMTVMDNLHRKGWLRRHVDGRAYRYEPTMSAEEYSAQLMRQALGAGSDRTATFMRFLDDLSPQEATALEEAYTRLAGEGSLAWRSGHTRRRRAPRDQP